MYFFRHEDLTFPSNERINDSLYVRQFTVNKTAATNIDDRMLPPDELTFCPTTQKIMNLQKRIQRNNKVQRIYYHLFIILLLLVPSLGFTVI
jgi:predicted nucleic acid-binding Zn ribbon protein